MQIDEEKKRVSADKKLVEISSDMIYHNDILYLWFKNRIKKSTLYYNFKLF